MYSSRRLGDKRKRGEGVNSFRSPGKSRKVREAAGAHPIG